MGKVIQLRKDDRPCILLEAVGDHIRQTIEFADGETFEILIDAALLRETLEDLADV